MAIEQRLAELGLILPEPPAPSGFYSPVVAHGGLVYVSGQVSREDGVPVKGPVSDDTPQETIDRAGKASVLRALSLLKRELGSLDRIERILFVRGYVLAAEGFVKHPKIVDSASKLLVDIFGEAGKHARIAVGVASLPDGGLLELELTAALKG